MSNQTEKEELIKQVEWLHKQFKDAAKPFTDRLAKLVALEPSPPLTVDFLNSIPEGVKNAFADAVATGTGIYNAADPARVIPAESILTPPAASGQQEVPQKQALLDALQEYLNARDDDVGPFFVAGAKQRAREAGEELYNLIDAIFAHPAPAQQESAPAPAALTDAEIHRIAADCGMYEQHDNAKPSASVVEDFARAILATASAAPAELARDAERLDFLISECAIVEEIGGNRYRLHWPDSQEWQQEMHGSAREAIDAAIASQQKGGA